MESEILLITDYDFDVIIKNDRREDIMNLQIFTLKS